MPIKVFECEECEKRFELLIRAQDDISDEKCPKCSSNKIKSVFASFSNYTIRGDNSASTRPKGRR